MAKSKAKAKVAPPKKVAPQKKAARPRTKKVVVSREADAGGRLLAAEADYLTAHGWSPIVLLSSGKVVGGGEVYWTRRGTTLKQDKAVGLQKLEDPLMADSHR